MPSLPYFCSKLNGKSPEDKESDCEQESNSERRRNMGMNVSLRQK